LAHPRTSYDRLGDVPLDLTGAHQQSPTIDTTTVIRYVRSHDNATGVLAQSLPSRAAPTTTVNVKVKIGAVVENHTRCTCLYPREGNIPTKARNPAKDCFAKPPSPDLCILNQHDIQRKCFDHIRHGTDTCFLPRSAIRFTMARTAIVRIHQLYIPIQSHLPIFRTFHLDIKGDDDAHCDEAADMSVQTVISRLHHTTTPFQAQLLIVA